MSRFYLGICYDQCCCYYFVIVVSFNHLCRVTVYYVGRANEDDGSSDDDDSDEENETGKISWWSREHCVHYHITICYTYFRLINNFECVMVAGNEFSITPQFR